MPIKKHLKSLNFFKLTEAAAIVVSMFGRKLAKLAAHYNLIAKSKFDFYQERNILIQKDKNSNILSFISKFSGKEVIFSIRRKTTDIVIFDEILLNGGYWPVVELCKKYQIAPYVIVDAGANVGSSVIFFKDAFPFKDFL